MSQVVFKASKYHADSGFQIDPDYSPKSIKLNGSGAVSVTKFIPKSECDLVKLKTPGEYEVRINRWLCEKDREFFQDVL